MHHVSAASKRQMVCAGKFNFKVRKVLSALAVALP